MSPFAPYRSRRFVVAAAAALVAAFAFLQPLPLDAQSSPAPPKQASEPEELPSGTPLRVEIHALRVEFDQQHKYGSTTSTDDLKALCRNNSVQGLAKALENEGTVTLLHRSEAKLVSGDTRKNATKARIFVGDEKPYVTRTAQNVSQSTVQSGMTVELSVVDQPDGRRLLDYSLDFDMAFREEVEDMSLIGRARIDSDSSAILAPGDMLVERFTRDTSKGPAEFIFLFLPVEERH